MIMGKSEYISPEQMVETIRNGRVIVAIIISDSFRKPGVNFCTPDNFSQQVAFIRHPQGKNIEAHVHNPVQREVLATQEVLHIKTGKLRVDFYDKDRRYLESRVLRGGDTIILVSGGHGFEVLEDIEMIEVKQGPYLGDADKTRFVGVTSAQARFAKKATDDSS
jgi:hypothetical protein